MRIRDRLFARALILPWRRSKPAVETMFGPATTSRNTLGFQNYLWRKHGTEAPVSGDLIALHRARVKRSAR